ncbi:MAG: hypothetical protein PWP23_2326 [Candidatus Sumerlaeota bacterium]|nr:hypothetical protein [Candidatus Sumerlaeota bacterium]
MTHTAGNSRFGFTAPAMRRFALAGLYGIALACSIFWVESRSVTATEPRALQPAKATETEDLDIVITSTFDVETWEVLLDGTALEAVESTPRQWRGVAELASPAGSELLLHASRVNMLYEEDEALRAELHWRGNVYERTAWGAFEITTLLDLGEVLR